MEHPLPFCNLFCWPFGATINECRMWFSQYGYVTAACDNASVYWHLADVSCPLLEECADVCGEEIQSCYPLCYHSVSPQRLLWHMRLITLAEITSSRLAAPLIVRMTSSTLSSQPFTSPDRGAKWGRESLPQRDPLSWRWSLVNAHFHLCWVPAPHQTTMYMCMLTSICTIGDFALA